MKEFSVGDIIQFKDIDYNNRRKIITSGYILHIKQDNSYVVGNVFVPYAEIIECLRNPKHLLNQITIVKSSDLVKIK